MNFLKKLILYIRNFFVKKAPCCGNLDKALSVADDVISGYSKATRHKGDVATSAMAYRHICTVRNHILRMRRTTEPDVFYSSFKTITLLTDRILCMESVHNPLHKAAKDISELFTTPVVRKPETRDGLVYYGVTFGGGSKEYYYLSDNIYCEEGRYVLVPVGEDNERKIAKVCGVYHFTVTNAPMPPDELKSVIEIVV